MLCWGSAACFCSSSILVCLLSFAVPLSSRLAHRKSARKNSALAHPCGSWQVTSLFFPIIIVC